MLSRMARGSRDRCPTRTCQCTILICHKHDQPLSQTNPQSNIVEIAISALVILRKITLDHKINFLERYTWKSSTNITRPTHWSANRADEYMRDVLGTIISKIPADGLVVRIEDAREQTIGNRFERPNGEAFDVHFSCRRLGQNNGFDTVVYLDINLRIAM